MGYNPTVYFMSEGVRPTLGFASQEVAMLENEKQTAEELAVRAMQEMAINNGDEIYYEAGDDYKSSFTRDSLIAMSLRGDLDLLESQTRYSLNRLGTKQDTIRGEEPGKAHHELPSIDVRDDLSSAYNACDTTAQLLLAIAALHEHGCPELFENYSSSIQAAIQYIRRHLNDKALFIEDPSFSGSTQTDGRQRKYALKVTYWKDSELNRSGRREPNYPIVYTLAHFQNAAALKKLGRLLDDEELVSDGSNMVQAGLQYLWKNDHFVTAIDGDGVIDGLSSDSLMALLYIDPSELPDGYARSVESYMRQLVTEAGYRSGIPAVADVDPYHMEIWTHEQALLNAAARRHGLTEPEEITRRIEPFIMPDHDIFPELVNPDGFQIDGNRKQLWAIGAYFYFNNPERSLISI